MEHDLQSRRLLDRFAAEIQARRHIPLRPAEVPLTVLGLAIQEFGRQLSRRVTLDQRVEETRIPRDAEGVPLGTCQKPFHLWNVEREERDYPYALSSEPPLQIGLLSRLTGDLSLPRIERLAGEVSAIGFNLIGSRFILSQVTRERRALLNKRLPFGRRDGTFGF